MSDQISVPYLASAFPSHVMPKGVLTFYPNELAHALFVTGRAPGDRRSYGQASVWEYIHRTSLIPAYLRVSGGGELLKSGLAQSLDRSEKVGVSYALGQAMTTIFSRHLLGVDFVMHVDRYEKRFRTAFGPTKHRPDLFGLSLTSHDWIVAEAKGRSNGMESGLLDKLKTQTGAVRTIAGQAPSISFGCVSSFPLRGPQNWGPMRIDAVDPKPSEEAIDLEVVTADFFRAYYEPFIAAIEFGQQEDQPQSGYVVATLGAGMRIGLARPIYNYFTVGDFTSDFNPAAFLDTNLPFEGVGSEFSDGTVVEVSWDDAFGIQDYDR